MTMNTVICTYRDNLNGKLNRTTIVYLDPPATWRDYREAIGAGLATGAAGVVIFLLLVGIWG